MFEQIDVIKKKTKFYFFNDYFIFVICSKLMYNYRCEYAVGQLEKEDERVVEDVNGWKS